MENVTAILQWITDNEELAKQAWKVLSPMVVTLAGSVLVLYFKHKAKSEALEIVGKGIANSPPTLGKDVIKANIKSLKANAKSGAINAINKMVVKVTPDTKKEA